MHLQNNYKCILRFGNVSELEFSLTFMLHCIYTEHFELAQAALKDKSTSRIQIIILTPMSCSCLSLFLQSQRNYVFLRKTIQVFSAHSGLLWWPTGFAV